jgi:hypothetical protein
MNTQQLFFALSSAAVFLVAPISSVYANTFEVGGVKQKFQQDGICTSFTVNQSETPVLVIPFVDISETTVGWINVNGQDTPLQMISIKLSEKQDSSVAHYRSKDENVSVIANYTFIPEKNVDSDGHEGHGSSESLDSITINYKGQSKTIQARGECSW